MPITYRDTISPNNLPYEADAVVYREGDYAVAKIRGRTGEISGIDAYSVLSKVCDELRRLNKKSITIYMFNLDIPVVEKNPSDFRFDFDLDLLEVHLVNCYVYRKSYSGKPCSFLSVHGGKVRNIIVDAHYSKFIDIGRVVEVYASNDNPMKVETLEIRRINMTVPDEYANGNRWGGFGIACYFFNGGYIDTIILRDIKTFAVNRGGNIPEAQLIQIAFDPMNGEYVRRFIIENVVADGGAFYIIEQWPQAITGVDELYAQFITIYTTHLGYDKTPKTTFCGKVVRVENSDLGHGIFIAPKVVYDGTKLVTEHVEHRFTNCTISGVVSIRHYKAFQYEGESTSVPVDGYMNRLSIENCSLNVEGHYKSGSGVGSCYIDVNPSLGVLPYGINEIVVSNVDVYTLAPDPWRCPFISMYALEYIGKLVIENVCVLGKSGYNPRIAEISTVVPEGDEWQNMTIDELIIRNVKYLVDLNAIDWCVRLNCSTYTLTINKLVLLKNENVLASKISIASGVSIGTKYSDVLIPNTLPTTCNDGDETLYYDSATGTYYIARCINGAWKKVALS